MYGMSGDTTPWASLNTSLHWNYTVTGDNAASSCIHTRVEQRTDQIYSRHSR